MKSACWQVSAGKRLIAFTQAPIARRACAVGEGPRCKDVPDEPPLKNSTTSTRRRIGPIQPAGGASIPALKVDVFENHPRDEHLDVRNIFYRVRKIGARASRPRQCLPASVPAGRRNGMLFVRRSSPSAHGRRGSEYPRVASLARRRDCWTRRRLARCRGLLPLRPGR